MPGIDAIGASRPPAERGVLDHASEHVPQGAADRDGPRRTVGEGDRLALAVAPGLDVPAYHQPNTSPAGPWQPSPAAAYGALYSGWSVAAGDGTRQVWARFTDCNGNPSAAVISDTIVLDQTPPPAPTLSGSPGNNKIDLSWTAVTDPGASASGIAHYRVFRLGTPTPIAVETDTDHRDSGLTGGQSYTYWVTAVDRAGNESAQSNHYTGTSS